MEKSACVSDLGCNSSRKELILSCSHITLPAKANEIVKILMKEDQRLASYFMLSAFIKTSEGRFALNQSENHCGPLHGQNLKEYTQPVEKRRRKKRH